MNSYYTTDSALISEPVSREDQIVAMCKSIAHLSISAKKNALISQDGLTRTEYIVELLSLSLSMTLMHMSILTEDRSLISLARKIAQ